MAKPEDVSMAPESSQFHDLQLDNTMVTSYPLGSETLGNQGLQDLYQFNKPAADIPFLPSSDVLLSQLSESQAAQVSRLASPDAPQVSRLSDGRLPRSHADAEHIGPIDVVKNPGGEHTEISTPKGDYFYKTPDGHWTYILPGGYEMPVENVNYDDQGNISFDIAGPDGAIERNRINADGTSSRESADIGGTIAYDKDGNVTEAPSGIGRMRQYHYTDGKLDKIDGNLGHWERVEKDGQVSWVNTEKGLKWDGDFQVDKQTGDLIFKARNGIAWGFTTRGGDRRQ